MNKDNMLEEFCHALNQLIENGGEVWIAIAISVGKEQSTRKFRCFPVFRVEDGCISGSAHSYGPFAGIDPWYGFEVRAEPKPTQ